MDEINHNNDSSSLLKELGLVPNGDNSRKRRLADYKTIWFFDYEQSFNYYAKKIMTIRQAKIRGEVIVAKPVLLLSLIVFRDIQTTITMKNT